MSLPRSSIVQAPETFGREWLVTNGIGGFACGTPAQANTRRYHGWLVASLRPPVDRVVLLAKADVTAVLRGRRYQLGCNEFADGTVSPTGYLQLTDFLIADGIPTWRYLIEDVVLEQRLWMAPGRNTTHVRFDLLAAKDPVTLEMNPLCTYRDYHSHTGGGWSIGVRADPGGCTVTAFSGARPYRLMLDRGEFTAHPEWYWRFRHRAEADRGLDDCEDLLSVGTFRSAIGPGESVTLTVTAEPDEGEQPYESMRRVADRAAQMHESVAPDAPGWIRRLTLAADQFIVSRTSGVGGVGPASSGKTVIAGYPWFSDWGRDTMIALPGLTVATGRFDDAAAILRTFAQHTSQGMLPNRFPDGGEPPEYNTVDAALWFFHAVAAYLDASGDQSLLRDVYPTLKDIISWHERGTRFSIQVDPADGLLRAGEKGVQLTWMDAKIGDWVVTPRSGKPVEINALWHYALTSMARWAQELVDEPAAAQFRRSADRVSESFSRKFWFESGGYLHDVIDPAGPSSGAVVPFADSTIRPNQIFAVSLGTGLLNPARARAVVDICSRELLTPLGLRSLSPRDSRYAGQYSGGPAQRDAVYHQGTVWGWLLGPFALAHYNVYKDARHALRLLEGLAPHLDDACIGTISEIFDGDAPHTPRGCFAQAWSVSETLRAWNFLRDQL